MDWDSLVDAAWSAREQAYAPYSKFAVGAALLAADGRIFVGCNVENLSFGLSNCAERTAIFHAVTQGEREFDAMAIVADGPEATPPCGACRQVLMEFGPDMRIILAGDQGSQGPMREFTAGDLLPQAFITFKKDK